MLLAEVSQPRQTISDEEIIARMMIPMINEVVRCTEEDRRQPGGSRYGVGLRHRLPSVPRRRVPLLDTLGTANYVELAQRYAHLGALYQVPAGLRAKAERNESYYPVATPLSDVATRQPA